MPSTAPLPTIDDLVRAANRGLVGTADRYADTVSGSILNHFAGPVAVLLSREADRDQDLFRDIYFDAASSDALTDLIQGRWGIARILDTRGAGVAAFARSSAAAGAGTLWRGTRVATVASGGNVPLVYEVALDTAAPAADVTLSVPIQATVAGTGVAIQASAGGLQLLDPVYDPLWKPAGLQCADGTDFEDAGAYLARARAQRFGQRGGYLARMTQVCQGLGAAFVIGIPSSYGLAAGDFTSDFGLNALYVADANYQSSPALIQSCAVALESYRVLGNDLWVGGIAPSALSVAAVATLVKDPGRLDQIPIRRAIVQRLLSYFAATSVFSFKLTGLAAAIQGASPNVQSAVFTSPMADALLAPNAPPAALPRYTLAPRDITLTFLGPS